MFELFAGLIATSLVTFGNATYVYKTIFGKVKPQRATWAVIETINVTTVANQFASGAKWSLLTFIMAAVLSTIILLVSIPRGVGGLNRRDIAIISLSVGGIVLWLLIDNPTISVSMTCLVIFLALYPTIEKTRKDPESESFIQWSCSAGAAFFAFLAVGSLDLNLILIPLSWLCVNLFLSIILYRHEVMERSG